MLKFQQMYSELNNFEVANSKVLASYFFYSLKISSIFILKSHLISNSNNRNQL